MQASRLCESLRQAIEARRLDPKDARSVRARRLIDARRAVKLTQLELSQQLGCSQALISKYERAILDIPEFILERTENMERWEP